MQNRATPANVIFDGISSYLSETDDPDLWQAVLRIGCDDISTQVSGTQSTRDVFMVIGPCSSWLRPHQMRWRVGKNEFAWPSGYGGSGNSRTGLPELDWCCAFKYSGPDDYTMIDIPRRFKKRQIVFRIAIPTQTIDRRKVSINMFWTPGTPRDYNKSAIRLLALLRGDTGGWKLVGSQTHPGELWRGELVPPQKFRMHPGGEEASSKCSKASSVEGAI